MRRPGWPALAAAATGIQVGSAIVATRYVIDEIDPVPLAFLRYVIGAACLAPFVVRAGDWSRMPMRDLVPVALCGVAQFGLLIVLLNAGLRTVAAGPGSLILATMPLLAMVIGVVSGQERWDGLRWLAILASVAGLAVALGRDALPGGGGSFAGEALILGAAATGALSSVAVRPYVQRYGALPVSAVAMIASVVALGSLAAIRSETAAIGQVSAGSWLIVAFLGVGSGVGYVLWLWALGRLAASRVTLFLTLSPVAALLVGWLFLGEPLTVATLLGLAIIVVALHLASVGRPTTPST